MNTAPRTINVDGNDYTLAAEKVSGNRVIAVLDRGWIGVGYRTEQDGEVTLTDCYNLRRWESGGFGGATLDPKGSGVEVDKMADVFYARGAEIMVVPIPEDWNE